jgi:hypothetical protein
MKRNLLGLTVVAAVTALAVSQPAFARSEAVCKKQWSSYDVDKSGHLHGKEMKVFYADILGEGNVVDVPESKMLTAAEFMKVCAADYREILSQAKAKSAVGTKSAAMTK